MPLRDVTLAHPTLGSPHGQDGARFDVRFGAFVDAIQPGLEPLPGEEVLDGNGGVLLPGLHDHHLHLLALAATADSHVARTRADLQNALVEADDEGWLRVIGFGEDDLTRAALDALEPQRPVRVQHRSGALWVLNSAALQQLGIDSADGRFWREDARLGELVRRIDAAAEPDLGWVGQQLLEHGITGATDATPEMDESARRLIAIAQETRELPQTIHLLGERKLVLGDHDLPTLTEIEERIAALHSKGLTAAIHCVTRESLALTIAALTEVGVLAGDRVEHAALCDEQMAQTLAQLGVAVATQPGFIADRGDDYLREIDEQDVCDLYRFRTLRDAGVSTVACSDAPFGPLDPWLIMQAARDRRAPDGRVIGKHESADPVTALAGYLLPLDDLNAPPRSVMVGAPADLLLLHVNLPAAVAEPHRDLVRQTWCASSSS